MASFMGGFLKHNIDSSSREEDYPKDNTRLNCYRNGRDYNFSIA
jgi:hypothetical protein